MTGRDEPTSSDAVRGHHDPALWPDPDRTAAVDPSTLPSVDSTEAALSPTVAVETAATVGTLGGTVALDQTEVGVQTEVEVEQYTEKRSPERVGRRKRAPRPTRRSPPVSFTPPSSPGPSQRPTPGPTPSRPGAVPPDPRATTASTQRRPRRRGYGCCLFRLIGLVLLVPFIYYGANVVDVLWHGTHDGSRQCGAIIVMGAAQYDGRPSAVLQSRLDHTLDLYKRGVAPTVVVTGGRAPGDRVTEATASVNYLTQRGMPERAILRETRGRTTFESISDSAAFLKPRGITTVVIVSDPYHSARAMGIAREQGLDATASPTAGMASAGLPPQRVLEESAVVSAGRVVGYRRASVVADWVQAIATSR